MAEGSKVELEQRKPVVVALKDNRLGYEIKTHGAVFKMGKDIFSPAGNQLGGDRFTKVYFRTESGNIYLVDRRGRLINADATKEKGRLVATQLDRENLESSELTINQPFYYGRVGHTTRVIEIVPTNDRRYSQSYLKEIDARKNNIIEDFESKVPPTMMVIEEGGGFLRPS